MASADSGRVTEPDGSEPEDWDEVLVRHLPAMRTFARMNLDPALRSREAVSDLVQSSLREVLAARDGIEWRNDAAFRSYLCTCVTRKILDKKRYWSRQKREASRERPLEDEGLALSSILGSTPESTPSALVVQGEQVRLLQQAFDALGARERRLFSMHFIFGLQPTHIGNELGAPESSVRRELARLQTSLASVLR